MPLILLILTQILIFIRETTKPKIRIWILAFQIAHNSSLNNQRCSKIIKISSCKKISRNQKVLPIFLNTNNNKRINFSNRSLYNKNRIQAVNNLNNLNKQIIKLIKQILIVFRISTRQKYKKTQIILALIRSSSFIRLMGQRRIRIRN